MRYAVFTSGPSDKHNLRTILEYRKARFPYAEAIKDAADALRRGPVLLKIISNYEEAVGFVDYIRRKGSYKVGRIFGIPDVFITVVFGNFQ